MRRQLQSLSSRDWAFFKVETDRPSTKKLLLLIWSNSIIGLVDNFPS
jgi:hypothetical protein